MWQLCILQNKWVWTLFERMVFSSIMLSWTLSCSFQATSAVRTVAQPRLARTASWCSRAPRTQRRGRRPRTTQVVGRWRRRRADVESVRAARWTSEDFVKCDILVDYTATYYVTNYRATYDILKATYYKRNRRPTMWHPYIRLPSTRPTSILPGGGLRELWQLHQKKTGRDYEE